MTTKFAFYRILIGTFFVIPFAVQANTINIINEAAPSYVDTQDSNITPQSSLMTSTSSSDYTEDMNKRKTFSGGYVGMGINYARSTSTVKITVSSVPPKSGEKDASSNDPGLDLNVGYGHVWGMFYLGGEAFADYAPMEMKVDDQSLNPDVEKSKISANYDVGAALKLGLSFFDSALLYGLAGFSVTQLKTSWGSLPSTNHSKVGPIFGIGLEYLMTQMWSTKLQYTHTSYSDITEHGTVDSVPVEGSFKNIKRNNFTLGVTCHF
jgi:opacity protein-like surface antigen